MRIPIAYIVSLVVFAGTSHAASTTVQTTSPELAEQVAQAWTRMVVEERGSWAGSSDPGVLSTSPLERGGRVVGHLVDLEPDGWVVVPLYRELAPVKAYAEKGRLPPEVEDGLPDLIKDSLEQAVTTIEEYLSTKAGSLSGGLGEFVEVDHSRDWDALLGGSLPMKSNEKTDFLDTPGLVLGGQYQEGEFLISSEWHQGSPYNYYTPGMGDCDHAPTGCVAVVGVQIMRYWNYPDEGNGSYSGLIDWANMPDTINEFSPIEQIEAVARLSANVGFSAELEYTCDRTGGYLWSWHDRDLEDALTQDFKYADTTADYLDRADYSSNEWWAYIKNYLGKNTPLPLSIPDHAVVIDGWQEIGSTPIRQYHINFGWGGSIPPKPGWDGYTTSNTWFTLDEIPNSSSAVEYLVKGIQPRNTLNSDLQGLPWNGIYINAYIGGDVTLGPETPPEPWLPYDEVQFRGETQFLPGMTVTCENLPEDPVGPVKFPGLPEDPAELFSRRGSGNRIVVHEGAVVIRHGGRLKLH